MSPSLSPSGKTSSKSRTPLFASNRSTQMKRRRRRVPLCEQEQPRAAEVIAGNPEAERAVAAVDVRVLVRAVLDQEAPAGQGVRPVHGPELRGRPSALFTFFQLQPTPKRRRSPRRAR